MRLKSILMEATTISNMLSRFRGTLLGGLLGDCCGAPFEGEILESSDKTTLRKYFDKLEGPFFKAPFKQYTDDTAMTKSIAKCLIDNKELVIKELAKKFIQEYYKEPNRGYGAAIVTVFEKLRQTKLSDPLQPAKEQFNGSGSYGNGAAMRVSPIPLFCHNKSKDQLIDMVKNSAIITHTHKLGINGAILQALAIDLCLKSNPENFDRNSYIDNLIENLQNIEADGDEKDLGLKKETPYQNQLKEIKRLLNPVNAKPSEDEILNILGHSVAALYSVPTAIFCFLKGIQDMEEVKSDNPFRRTIEYAISLGGDTDTIASMAGSLVGALYGDTIIPENLIKHCEASDEIINLADELYKSSISE